MAIARTLTLPLVVAAMLGAIDARGQSTPNERRADQLFNEAKALTDSGAYPQACPKLEESQQLDPALGTQFNLADCYEHTNRAALAYKLFTEVGSAAHAAGKTQREKEARARATTLEARIARLTIFTTTVANLSGLAIRCDGIKVTSSDFGKPIVVEPGQHAIEASADGTKSWRTTIELRAGGRADISVPELGAEVAQAPSTTASLPAATESSAPTSSGTRNVALIVGGIGAVSLAVGAVFGIMSISDHGTAKETCPQPNPCSDPVAAQKWTDATSAGNVATIGFVAGGTLLAGAGVLWLVSPSPKEPVASRGSRLQVAARFGGSSILVQGQW